MNGGGCEIALRRVADLLGICVAEGFRLLISRPVWRTLSSTA